MQIHARAIGNRKRVLDVFFVMFRVSALAHNGIVKSGPEGVGKLVNLVVAVNFDGLFGGIENHMAFVAPMQVLIELGFKAVRNLAIQIIGQLL